jgi:phasin
MSKKLKVVDTTETTAEVADFARKSVDQAQAAFDKASDFAHSNMQNLDAVAGAFKARSTDIQMKAMEIAQINMNSAFTFVRKAFSVKDPAEFFSLSQSYVNDQFAVFSRQAKEMSELSMLLATETAKPVQDGLMKSFTNLSKSVAA